MCLFDLSLSRYSPIYICLYLYILLFLEKKTDHEEKAEGNSAHRAIGDNTVAVSSGKEAFEVINDSQNSTSDASDTKLQDPAVDATSEVFTKMFWDCFYLSFRSILIVCKEFLLNICSYISYEYLR